MNKNKKLNSRKKKKKKRKIEKIVREKKKIKLNEKFITNFHRILN